MRQPILFWRDKGVVLLRWLASGLDPEKTTDVDVDIARKACLFCNLKATSQFIMRWHINRLRNKFDLKAGGPNVVRGLGALIDALVL